jgi:hypothetical protein
MTEFRLHAIQSIPGILMGPRVNQLPASDSQVDAEMPDSFLRMLSDSDRVTMLLLVQRIGKHEIAEVPGVDEAVLQVKISRLREKFKDTSTKG